MEYVMLLTAVVILICVASDKLSGKIGVPALVIFIIVGMLFGSDGVLKIPLDDYKLVEQVCTAALIAIMFYGGFSTNWKMAKPVAVKAVCLSTFGVIITAGLVCLFCYYVLNIDFYESILAGAVISSTDAASVFSILRSKNLNLKGGLAPLLEVESGSNDPVSYMLTMIGLSLITNGNAADLWSMVALQIVVGLAVGAGIGKLSVWLLKRTSLIAEGLDSVCIVALVLVSYALTSILHGNGYLSVYLTGIILGNSKISHKGTLVHFFDGVSRLSQITVFFLLGLLAFPSQIPGVMSKAVLIAVFLTFAARPAAVFLLMGRQYGVREKLFISWSGLRGAASIVFAIMVVVSGTDMKNDLFHIVFGISLLSVTVQGTLLPYMAGKLDLIDNNNDVHKTFNDYQEESAMTMMRMFIPPGHHWAGKTVDSVAMPAGSLALMVKRKEETIVPKGNTVIEAGDTVILSVPGYDQTDDFKLREFVIEEGNEWAKMAIEELSLPEDILIALIRRGEESIIPDGKTVIHTGDTVVLYDR